MAQSEHPNSEGAAKLMKDPATKRHMEVKSQDNYVTLKAQNFYRTNSTATYSYKSCKTINIRLDINAVVSSQL